MHIFIFCQPGTFSLLHLLAQAINASRCSKTNPLVDDGVVRSIRRRAVMFSFGRALHASQRRYCRPISLSSVPAKVME